MIIYPNDPGQNEKDDGEGFDGAGSPARVQGGKGRNRAGKFFLPCPVGFQPLPRALRTSARNFWAFSVITE